MFATGLWWSLSFSGYGGAVLIVVEALTPALACALTPPRRGRVVALAGAMVLVEALRDRWPFGGLPLGGVALGQAAGPLAGSARIGGPLLVVGAGVVGGRWTRDAGQDRGADGLPSTRRGPHAQDPNHAGRRCGGQDRGGRAGVRRGRGGAVRMGQRRS